MQRITFEGCTCIVAAPEDIEQLERELTAAKEENANLKTARDADFEIFHQMRVKLTAACGDPYKLHDEALDAVLAQLALLRTETQEQARLLGMSGEREADLRGEIERLRRRVEAADGLVEEAQILANILRANTDVHGRCLLERDMTIGLRAALLTFRATEGKK